MAREYIETLTLTHDQVQQMMDAQQAMYDEGLIKQDSTALIELLGDCSTVLGFAFMAPTPVAVAGAIAALIATLGSDIATLDPIVKNGYWYLGKVETYMRNNPQYDLIKIKMSFLEYTDQNIRFVEYTDLTDALVALHLKDGSGWITA